MKPIFVILVSHRRLEHLKRTIESLVPTLPPGSMLAVHDNNSDEDTRWYLRNLAESWKNDDVKLRITLHGENKGWGWAMNHALTSGYFSEWRDYEYVLESNNDVIYEPDWCEKAQFYMEKYQAMGLLALWKHIHHGTVKDLGDVLHRDNAPAVSWFFRSKDLQTFLPFPEHGSTKTTGGNGEDVAFIHKIVDKGFWIGSPKNDLSHHMDGYNLDLLGKDNPVYL